MRDAYQEQLHRLANGLADMCNLVAEALDNATRALLRADLRLAEQVITDDGCIDDLRTPPNSRPSPCSYCKHR